MIRKIRDVLIGAACAITICYIFVQIVVQDDKCDIKGIVYKKAWSQSIIAGKTLVTVHHPAGFYEVCLKY